MRWLSSQSCVIPLITWSQKVALMESESHPEGTGLGAGGGWETTGAVDFSEALVLPTDKCLAEGSSLLPIRLRDSLSCTHLKILENCKSE